MLDNSLGATRRPVPEAECQAPAPAASRFVDLGLESALVDALGREGYQVPTPIQVQAIPHLLAGRDLLGVAQTGTGKTAAFALPILQRLGAERLRPTPNRPRALVLAPTRELASQVTDRFVAYGRGSALRFAVVFGGVGQGPQVRALRQGVDVLVATPGRLLDLMQQRHVDLSRVGLFVLDEADRMLDMGFLRDVRRIVGALPDRRQSLLFSATMPADIQGLAQSLLRDPVRVEVTPPSTTVARVEQRVCFVDKQGKRALLTEILSDAEIERALVFTRTKHGADKVCRHLEADGIHAAALHGNKSQGQRERALDAFRKGTLRALVATDIAARGLDVPGITHVINFDMPNLPESYVHRIGRTARAGRDGVAISFCDPSEQAYLRDIQREIRREIEVMRGVPTADAAHAPRRRGSGRASAQKAAARRPAGAGGGARRFNGRRARLASRW
jgi:ATP-dependent RNA helicase RhlE